MLSKERMEAFRRDGYLKLPGAVGDEEVHALRALVDDLTARVSSLPEDKQVDFHRGALFGESIGRGPELCRLEYTFDKDALFLVALGNPEVLNVAASLQDGPVVVTWEDMVLKMPGSGHDVPIHQDSDYQSVRGVVFSLGIYLDASHHDPLLVYPGTHRIGPLSEDEVGAWLASHSEQPVAVSAEPGDVVVHNVRVLHGSGCNAGPTPRRVLYFEFRAVDQVLHDSPWGADWLARRLPYIPLAMRLRGESPFAATDDPRLVDELLASRHEWLPDVPEFDPSDVDLRVHHHDFAACARV